tara:strand:- start:1100 stop:1426 length:327 start_codon:yes stop_codon:yes gene_type:complete
MYMVEAECLWIFDQFDAGTPRVENESDLEESWHIPPSRPVLVALETDARSAHTYGFELGHFFWQVGHRESDVINPGALAATCGCLGDELDLYSIAVRGVTSVGDRFAA